MVFIHEALATTKNGVGSPHVKTFTKRGSDENEDHSERQEQDVDAGEDEKAEQKTLFRLISMKQSQIGNVVIEE